MKKHTVVLAFASTLLCTLPARAELIDFTSSTWTSATSFVDYGSLRVHVSVAGGALSVTPFDGNAGAAPCTPATLACQRDGLGIGPGDDEVTFGGSEILTVSFTDLFNTPLAVTVLGIHFFDLFQSLAADPQPETAQWAYDIGGGGLLTGTQVGAGTGWASVGTNVSGVTWIQFFATAPLSSANTDFALAALEVEPIPEPTTLLLLGGGLVGLVTRQRRQKR